MGLGDDISKRTFDNFFYEEQERDTHVAGGSNSDLGCGRVLMARVHPWSHLRPCLRARPRARPRLRLRAGGYQRQMRCNKPLFQRIE